MNMLSKNMFKRKAVIASLALVTILSACGRKEYTDKNKYIVEVIGSDIDYSKLKLVAKQNGVEDSGLYQWKNHVVLYSRINTPDSFTKALQKEFPDAGIKIYNKPFYNFTKSELCTDNVTAKEWEHILLTANLVEDKQMQQEYLQYHKTQFSDWPEIAEGFCNADFQQLLVYKNERQLMLVISIPADKTLDELNPKTTENNPRMDEWNQIMGKYQEGIKGTKPGEKWVFLSKI
jgi:hypothetical protein